MEFLKKRAAEEGINGRHQWSATSEETCYSFTTVRDKSPTSDFLISVLSIGKRALYPFNTGEIGGIYPGGSWVNAANWELYICVPEELRKLAYGEGVILHTVT